MRRQAVCEHSGRPVGMGQAQGTQSGCVRQSPEGTGARHTDGSEIRGPAGT